MEADSEGVPAMGLPTLVPEKRFFSGIGSDELLPRFQ
jgi:hypothetical protein